MRSVGTKVAVGIIVKVALEKENPFLFFFYVQAYRSGILFTLKFCPFSRLPQQQQVHSVEGVPPSSLLWEESEKQREKDVEAEPRARE